MKIQNKLFVTWLFSSALLIVAMVIIMQWSVDRGMLEYINTREANSLQPVISSLENSFQKNQNWEEFANKPRLFNHFIHNIRRTNVERRLNREIANGPQQHRRPSHFRQRLPMITYSLFNPDKSLITGNPNTEIQLLIPVNLDGNTVAWLGMRRHQKITEIFELQFLNSTKNILLITAIVMIMLSVAFTLPLARHFVSPIQKITDFVHNLSRGSYEAKLTIKRSDEFSKLANDINELSTTLKENDNIRKRWLADISHELRTPLAILRGEIEAMVDGIRPSNQQNLASLQQEAIHLSNLVDDLYELSSADIGGLRYQKEKIDLGRVLQQQLEHHTAISAERGLTLELNLTSGIFIYADIKRFNQLIDNLIDNACKYTDAKGVISIKLKADKHVVTLVIEDSAPGVPEESLNKMFDHLFRVEDSRNRKTGGSGLGLAIVKRIIDAHQGTIVARHSSLGGVQITMTFPRI